MSHAITLIENDTFFKAFGQSVPPPTTTTRRTTTYKLQDGDARRKNIMFFSSWATGSTVKSSLKYHPRLCKTFSIG
jgi:hypothetical protein